MGRRFDTAIFCVNSAIVFLPRFPAPYRAPATSWGPKAGGLGWVGFAMAKGGGIPVSRAVGRHLLTFSQGGSLGPREGPGRVVQLTDAGRCVLRPLELHHRCGDTESGVQTPDLTYFLANLAQKKFATGASPDEGSARGTADSPVKNAAPVSRASFNLMAPPLPVG